MKKKAKFFTIASAVKNFLNSVTDRSTTIVIIYLSKLTENKLMFANDQCITVTQKAYKII